ncbi:MAG: hypothetical protein LBH61_06520, partial [Dysgonamonadaceae bacterium]|nr:hypothetical protein [Dysgonamonadaceae bacterium]
YSCSENYLAALREADKKVFIKENQQDESLLYDFGLEVGDAVEKNELSYTVTKIDTVLIGETQRKRFFFNDHYDVWIEGIGSLHHFHALEGFSLGYEAESINYQKKGEGIVYAADADYFNANECKTDALDAISSETIFPVFNRNSNQLEVYGLSDGVYVLELNETNGTRLFSGSIDKRDNRLNTSSLFPGVYIYRLLKKGHVVSSGSIIK